MINKINVVVLIPSLNPNDLLIKYVTELIKIGFPKIIVVNDGSSNKYDKYFNKLKKIKECIVLKHDANYGKGKALKTGFIYYLNNLPSYDGIVTADSDGQHTPVDTLEIAKTLAVNKSSFILGTRCFDEKQVPFKSKYGNKITTFILKKIYGKEIKDTQTGLRAIPNHFIKKIISLDGDRFEYEINVLIEAIKEDIKIIQVPIKTIYIGNNKNSHFKAFKDAYEIYSLILSNRKE